MLHLGIRSGSAVKCAVARVELAGIVSIWAVRGPVNLLVIRMVATVAINRMREVDMWKRKRHVSVPLLAGRAAALVWHAPSPVSPTRGKDFIRAHGGLAGMREYERRVMLFHNRRPSILCFRVAVWWRSSRVQRGTQRNALSWKALSVLKRFRFFQKICGTS